MSDTEERLSEIINDACSCKITLPLAYEVIKDLFPINKTEWVSVSKALPPLEKKVLLYWRPINHKNNPRARATIVGELSMYGPDNYTNIDDPRYVWANGMYYDLETHITHWCYLPKPPNDKEKGEL